MKKILLIAALFITAMQAKATVRLDVVVDPALCGQTFETGLEWLDLSTCIWGGGAGYFIADGQTYTYFTGDAWRLTVQAGPTSDMAIILGDPACGYNTSGSANVPLGVYNACGGSTTITPFNVSLVNIGPNHYEIRFTP